MDLHIYTCARHRAPANYANNNPTFSEILDNKSDTWINFSKFGFHKLPKVASKVHKPKKAKEVSQKAIQWAEKMNKEFAELENFELSIEG
ncbi:uncharacterized protein LOC135468836 isoform X4 [Liolophura sinensis]|uniref:uncharacterized protein LOC135468836 isoform X4 n=1 Tax=Liolophura sinensis TaxID=3198878 RepID=UPI003158E2CF